MDSSDNKKRWLRDLCLIAALLLLAGLSWWLLAGQSGSDEAEVVVYVHGDELARYPLTAEGSYVLNGGTNTLVIEGGYAWLSEANCPDKLCVHMGRIHINGQTIVCLPNRLYVIIEGGDEPGVDAMG